MSTSFKELPVISSGPLLHNPKEQDPILGIDLGTTNSLAAIVENGVPRILKTREGKNLLPSVVHFLSNGEIEVGVSAKKQRALDASHTVYSVKRLLGKGAADLETMEGQIHFDIDTQDSTNIRVKVRNRSYTPIEISAMILSEIKKTAEETLGKEIEDAVVTVPAYFNDSQRQATRAAGRLAGLNVLRILNEPTAAALAYGLQKKKNGVIAVYDLGGGTFDVSILRLREGVFEVLATNGNTQLGGDDIDHAIVGWMESTVLSTYPQEQWKTAQTQALLLETAENLKITLSTKEVAEAQLTLSQGQALKVSLDVSTLEKLALPLLEQTKEPVLNAMQDASLSLQDLTDVVVVGGPTRLPFVRDFIAKLFHKTPNTSLNPDEVVALGAAIQADILAGNNTELLLLDVVPLSLGIETFGGAMNALIPRNSRIPILAKEQFTTYVDGQTKVAINVFQGERQLVLENRKLGQITLSGIPPLPAGAARVEVTFLVDADGILSVSAKELYSGIEQSIEVRPTYGLTDEEVEKMLSEGLAFASQDRAKKKLIEAKNDAQTILLASEKALERAKEKLSSDEKKQISSLIAQMKSAVKSENEQAIRDAHEALNKGTQKLAELVMNLGLEEDLKNTKASHILDG